MNTIFFIFSILVLLHFDAKLYIISLLAITFLLFVKSYVLAIIIGTICLIFCIPMVRRYIISAPLLGFIKTLGVLPKISDTEKTALDAGTTWVEGEFFKTKPNLAKILAEPFEPNLSEDEKRYLANEVEEICNSTSDWEIFENKDLSPSVWQKLKDKRIFGMIIPKEYGGLEFSPVAQSAIVGKLASVSQVLAITTMVPNSLGPGELLLKYGTEKQKQHYLPRLANGTDIPCFGLTEPMAGSDAASIKSHGVLFKEGDRLKIRINFEKRYITLGGIATVIGLAFKLEDPENLIPSGRKIGITCALLKGDLPGIIRGRRHMPMHVPFINSPIWGKDVVIDVEEDVIGGVTGLGEGWRMLMECLSVGRGISLPSVAGFASKFCTLSTLMYSSIRKQFGMPIAKFEAIEEVLARMIANTYTSEAVRIFTASAVKNGNKPAITNAIAKYHTTEISRKVVNDAMDILGGAAISTGPNNLVAHAYMGVPVGITVEGANIITRALLQFGQGLMRCHPFLYNEMVAIQSGDLKSFDKNFWSHFGSFFVKRVRMFTLTIKRFIVAPFCHSIESKYSLKIERISARFAFLSDLILLLYGGSFKIKEKLSGRFADVVSHLYIMSAILRKFKADNYKKELEPVVIFSLEQSLNVIDKAVLEIYENLSANPIILNLVKILFLLTPPIRESKVLKDKITYNIVKNISSDQEILNSLFSDVFVSKDPENRLNMIANNFKDIKKAVEIIKRVKRAKINYSDARSNSLITEEEFSFIIKWEEVAQKIVQVDHFPL